MVTGVQGPPPSDDLIVRRLRKDDESVLEQLVALYWQPLVRFAGGIVQREGAAEDVVQEAFIRLWSRRHTLGFEGSVRAFLYTLTRNAAIDEHRRLGRQGALTTRAATPAAPASPLSHAVESELRKAAEAAVEALPPRRREVFRLARIEGLTYREIAQVMDLSPQTVANQMSRALTDLHRALDPLLGHDSGEGPGPSDGVEGDS